MLEFGTPQPYNAGSTDIGLEYLGTEVPLCLNTPIENEEFVSFLTSPGLQNLKRGREAVTKPREKDTRFSVPSKEGLVVKQSGIYIIKYLDTHFLVSKSAITNLSI
jgi:hypothetical protein